MKTAVKLYVQKATDIADAEALAMPDMFRTWEEVLEAGEALEANTVLRIGRQLYRVVQQVTPQAHQRPDGEGMLAVYRPIDQSHAGTLEDPVPSSTAWTRRRESITATAGRSTCATRTWPRACGRLTRRGCGSGRKPMPLAETVADLCRVIETLEGIVRRQAAELEQLGALAHEEEIEDARRQYEAAVGERSEQ